MTNNLDRAEFPTTSLDQVDLEHGTIQLEFQPASLPGECLFIVDVYTAGSNHHPTDHLGWWAWPTDQAQVAQGLRLTYTSAKHVQVVLLSDEGERAADECWVNPDYFPRSHLLLSLIWHDAHGKPRKQAEIRIDVQDDSLLRGYYADNGRRYAMVSPFLEAFHQRRLDVLRQVFRGFIAPGSRVLDVGSGHSMFYLTNGDRWPFQVTCIDLDRALIQQIGPERPRFTWMVGALQQLPFAEAGFDALYAGEVIEHVADGAATVREWARVVRPGGVVIVTTPNRLRLLNRLNAAWAPVSFEHLIEYSRAELRAMFDHAGLETRYEEGIYLELLAIWRQHYPHIDPLNIIDPLPRHLPLLRPCMLLGRLLPDLAYDLVIVGRKRG